MNMDTQVQREQGRFSKPNFSRLLDYSCNLALDNTNKVISLWTDTHNYFT